MNRTCGCFVASASGSNSAASAVSNRRKCILIALPSLQQVTSGTAERVGARSLQLEPAATTSYTIDARVGAIDCASLILHIY